MSTAKCCSLALVTNGIWSHGTFVVVVPEITKTQEVFVKVCCNIAHARLSPSKGARKCSAVGLTCAERIGTTARPSRGIVAVTNETARSGGT